MKFKLINRLGLSYCTPNKLNSIVDGLHGHLSFQFEDFDIGNESLRFHFRDIVGCIRAIYGDPEFAQDLVFAPERHFLDHERTQRVYSEMHTGDWWWSKQVCNTNSVSFLY